MNRVRLFLPIALLLLLSSSVPSCAVFEVVGNAMSRLYDNSVSYFNSYYNAKRNFGEAEEALLVAERFSRGKAVQGQRTPPPTGAVRDRLNAVIDKCSSILSFYPKSALVDDALLLIGKSYYYLQEHLKAERKFSELLAEFPNSELALHSRFWLAKTLQHINREEDAQREATRVAQDAIDQKEYQVAAEAYALLGKFAKDRNRASEAIEYYTKAAEHAQDDEIAATANIEIGDSYFSMHDYEKAALAYTKVFNRVSDVYLNYYSRLQAARAYSELKRYDTALYLTSEMLDTYRYAEYFPTIRLEQANVLMRSGQTEHALDEYRFVDTTYQRTEASAGASFALANYLEHTVGDYSKARGYYMRASTMPGTSVAELARRRDAGLGKILSLQRQLFVIDSLVALSDSVLAYPEHFAPPPDTTAPDTTLAELDTANTLKAVLPPPFKPVNKDSMQVVKARRVYDLGEVYYTDLEMPDSALVWFQRAVDWNVDSTVAPRAYFILAGLGKATNTRSEHEIADLYQLLIDRYPRSQYAEEARKFLGLPLTQRTVQEDLRTYATAESLIFLGKYVQAIDAFKAILADHPSPSLSAKSQYAIGWVYEHYLANPDSAIAYYRMLAEQHGATPYAAAVKEKLPDEKKPEDSSKHPEQQQQPTQPEVQPKPVPDDDVLLKARPPVPQGARRDTVKVKVIE